jgi:hypothetical protein
LPNPALGPAIFPNPVLGQPPIVRTDLGIFEGSTFETDREDTGSLKVDYRITQKDSLALRYNIDSSFTNTQYGIAADQVSPSPGLNHLFKATWDHTFRPTLLNEFGVAYNRPKTDSLVVAHSHHSSAQHSGDAGTPTHLVTRRDQPSFPKASPSILFSSWIR